MRVNHPARDARCGVRDNIADSMANRLTLILTFSLREKESLEDFLAIHVELEVAGGERRN